MIPVICAVLCALMYVPLGYIFTHLDSRPSQRLPAPSIEADVPFVTSHDCIGLT